ncbi:MFS transporter [Tessaracoccus aquimaris]|uniref:MFS transporter n=1 Tax=Tessaracoccus aquimaris TaxID=1332264 RepID=UPI001D038D7C|nr:MFS transporter [Tessaracoccus aquimaris]
MRRTRQPIPGEIWVLVSAALLIALGYGLVAPILPQFARSFDVGVILASAIVTVFALVRLLFAPAGGALVAKFGERRIYMGGLIIVAVSSAACGFAPDYWSLLIFRGLGGIGSVMFTVSSMGLLVRLSPPAQRGHTSSLYGTAFLLGNILGPILGSLLQGFGMRVPFFIYAATVGVAVLVVAIFLRGGAGASPPTMSSRSG